MYLVLIYGFVNGDLFINFDFFKFYICKSVRVVRFEKLEKSLFGGEKKFKKRKMRLHLRGNNGYLSHGEFKKINFILYIYINNNNKKMIIFSVFQKGSYFVNERSER